MTHIVSAGAGVMTLMVSLGTVLWFLCSLILPTAVAAQTPGIDLPAPAVTVSLDGSREARLFPGHPLLVRVALLNPENSKINDEPLLLAADAGSWTNTLHLEVTSPNGAPILWDLMPITATSDQITLPNSGYVELAWWLAPAESRALVPGNYRVVAWLDTTAVLRTDSWHGVARSVPANVEIVLEPALLSEAESERKQIVLAQHAFSTGQHADALAPLNELLAQYPANIGGLTLKSALQLELGQIEPARQTCEAALAALFARTPNPPEPPLLLLEIQARIETKSRQHSITSFQVVGNLLTLSWEAELEESYQVERSLDLLGWEPLTGELKATDLMISFTTNLFGPASYFRVLRH